MKVAVVIGHNEKRKGAYSKYFNMREWDFYNKVNNCLHGVTTYWHNANISGYTTRIKDTANRINKDNYDLVIELHFNSFTDATANGCETLYFFKSKQGKKYAQMFSDLVNQRTGIKIRGNGVKALANKRDRGFASVYYTNAPTILIEPFFGSNENDCKLIECTETVASIINEFINKID